MPRSMSKEARLIHYVDRSGGPEACWPYTGPRTRHGYGAMEVREDGARRLYLAHRVAYAVEVGPIPEGRYVRHRCDNPPCCNPRHLLLGTQQDNMDDMWQRGRQQSYLDQAKGIEVAQARLTDALVLEMRARFAAGESTVALGKAYGVSQVQAWNIVHRRQWKHLP